MSCQERSRQSCLSRYKARASLFSVALIDFFVDNFVHTQARHPLGVPKRLSVRDHEESIIRSYYSSSDVTVSLIDISPMLRRTVDTLQAINAMRSFGIGGGNVAKQRFTIPFNCISRLSFPLQVPRRFLEWSPSPIIILMPDDTITIDDGRTAR